MPLPERKLGDLKPVPPGQEGWYVSTADVNGILDRLWDLQAFTTQTGRRERGYLLPESVKGPFTLGGNATGRTLTPDPRGALKMSWQTATGGQYVAAIISGTWDLSLSDVFALDVGFDGASAATAFSVRISSDSTLSSYANFANSGSLSISSSASQPKRMTIPIVRSAMTTTGSVDWSAIRHVEIRFARYQTGTAGRYSALLHGFWVSVAARPRVLLTFDDAVSSFYEHGFPRMQTAGMRGTMYAIGSRPGDSGYMTLPQIQALYRAGWDVGGHTWSHVPLATRPTSYTRSGSTATLVVPSTHPHGKSVGNSVTIAGCDEPEYNGTFTIATVPNVYTMTFEVPTTSLSTTAWGDPYIVDSPTLATIQSEIAQTRDWLIANGMPGGAGHIAYPWGYFSPLLEAALPQLGIWTGRAVNAGVASLPTVLSTFTGLGDPYRIRGYAIDQKTAATVLGKVDEAVEAGSTVILFGHGLVASSAGANEMLISEFQSLLDGIASRRDAGLLDVVTISEWYGQVGATTPAPPPPLQPFGRQTPTYGATIDIDASTGSEFVINVADGSDFTVNAPTNGVVGQRITVRIRNTSAGAVGKVYLNAVSLWRVAGANPWDLRDGSLLSLPASGYSRSVDFQLNAGGAWVEAGRTPADVQN
jgi:peptidoglycan/xylan/chitin deacetylase (PgdA/CDA1 family)